MNRKQRRRKAAQERQGKGSDARTQRRHTARLTEQTLRGVQPVSLSRETIQDLRATATDATPGTVTFRPSEDDLRPTRPTPAGQCCDWLEPGTHRIDCPDYGFASNVDRWSHP